MRSVPGRFGVISASIALAVACTSAPTQPPIETTGTGNPITGGSGGSSVDAGSEQDGGSCAPSLGDFTPIYHAAARTAGACTAAQLLTVYDACFASGSTPSTCTTSWTTVATNATCNSCLLANSDPTGSTWGPIVQYDVGIQLNVGGCVALDVPSEEAGDCAQAGETLAECINAACDTTCGGSSAAFISCQSAAQADATACSTYLAAYQSACATLSSSVCFSGAGDEATFAAIAGVFCE
jgi:hypothetical protein